jgi:hypothetical protein
MVADVGCASIRECHPSRGCLACADPSGRTESIRAAQTDRGNEDEIAVMFVAVSIQHEAAEQLV